MMFLLATLFACNSPCSPGPEPTLALGYGWQDYTPASDGEEVTLVYGQQGGYHIDIAVATTQLDGSELLSGSFYGRLDGEVVAEAQPWFDLVCDRKSGTQRAYGLRLIFWELEPPDLDGRTIEVEGTVRDVRGMEATDALGYVVIDPGPPL